MINFSRLGCRRIIESFVSGKRAKKEGFLGGVGSSNLFIGFHLSDLEVCFC